MAEDEYKIQRRGFRQYRLRIECRAESAASSDVRCACR